ncbi:MAG: biotin/lipoyl-binding protein [Caldilineae bacterium]|nr:MAG: biotin/lipoyl-binding protein [Caldilineae bacterium]
MSKYAVTIEGTTFEVEIQHLPASAEFFSVRVNGEELMVRVPKGDQPTPMHWIIVDNKPYEVVLDTELRWIKAWSGWHAAEIRDLEAVVERPTSGDGRVKAPIPGLITAVFVRVGDEVKVGQALLELEAMKMENEIQAPRAGVVTEVRVRPGQTVGMGEMMVEIS